MGSAGRLLFLLATVASVATAAETVAVQPREIFAPSNGRALRVSLGLFSDTDFVLRVLDNAAPHDAPRFKRLATGLPALGAAAGCNGGFFGRKPFEPVGLMIASGIRAGTFDPQSWMQGIVTVRAGRLDLEEAATFRDTSDVTEALQSGPWLVRDGKTVESSDRRVARRTFICTDGGNQWAIGVIDACTLGELAAVLAGEEIRTLLIVRFALNLDGGPSTGLWIAGETGAYSSPEGWPVRNYLAIFHRTESSAAP